MTPESLPETFEFGIEIKFDHHTNNPARIFRAMSSLIDVVQEIDRELVRAIDGRIEPVLILEDVRPGSLRTWLSSELRRIDDSDIEKLDWRAILGKYLVRAKWVIVRFLEGRVTLASREELREVERDLFNLASQTQLLQIPAYNPIPVRRLVNCYERVSASLALLADHDAVVFLANSETIAVNPKFSISSSAAEEILTEETINNEAELILKVKKPDYLGASMWEFRHEDRSLQVKISDSEWLNAFQGRHKTVRPGDSLRARVLSSVAYDENHEVLTIHYEIIKVIDVLEQPRQPNQTPWPGTP